VELLRGVDQPRPGLFRVRLSFPGLGVHCETFNNADDANARIIALKESRAAGHGPGYAPRSMTLRAAADAALAIRLVSVSRTGEFLKPGGAEWWHRVMRPWTSGEFADVPVHLLDESAVVRYLRGRYAAHPKTAVDESIGLRDALTYARDERCNVPDRLLTFRLPKPPKAKRHRILTADETLPFAMCAPAAYGRLIVLQGRIGNRIGELLQSRVCDWDVADLHNATLTVPDPKESARTGEKVIPLFPDEAALAAEQIGRMRAAVPTPTAHLPATPPGPDTRLVWPMPDGRAWPIINGRVAHAYFDRHVWRPTMAAAESAGLRVDPALTSHSLRKTAITRMRDMGMSMDATATRVGHADGTLIRTIYDHGSAAARVRTEIAAFAALDRERATTANAASSDDAPAATTRPSGAVAAHGKGT